ncbi:PEBP-like protein [Coprinopsis marcescibilis]|uniref:PEBP-like protein n=1 Tax=Coprinopsis marcescibilis TaxID=230819 RepID=A0A5C3KHP1_COPMA|nr:PEBP-like protein [Coprinopsis marcescibilis]
MRFPSLIALVSAAACALAQDTDINEVVSAFTAANIPANFNIRFNPTALLQATFTRNGVATTFKSGQQVNRDATQLVPSFKVTGVTDPGPYVIANVDPDGGQFGHVRHYLAGNFQLTGSDLRNTSAPVTAWFQPSPGAGQPAHRYVFWLFKQSANFNQQRLVTPTTFIGNWNLSSFAAQTGLGDPIAATFMYVRQ